MSTAGVALNGGAGLLCRAPGSSCRWRVNPAGDSREDLDEAAAMRAAHELARHRYAHGADDGARVRKRARSVYQPSRQPCVTCGRDVFRTTNGLLPRLCPACREIEKRRQRRDAEWRRRNGALSPTHTCRTCGAEFPRRHVAGRPPTRCPACRAKGSGDVAA